MRPPSSGRPTFRSRVQRRLTQAATSAPHCGSSVFSVTGDELEVHLGALDAPNQFKPTYELWTVRRESWLPAFPGTKLYERHGED